ncbi:MAG: DctP family TRAP transporter solute-binding subunit [Gammaproteobacteria bacterium]|nr:DctP family TRAP transporter solute-binding subunit [Gammaproteobacteria bacterium]
MKGNNVQLGIAAVLLLLLSWIIVDYPVISPPLYESAGETQTALFSEGEEPVVWALRFGHNIPVESALHQAAERYADQVKHKSKGRVVIAIYPAQQLGNDHQMVEMARAGELDLLLTPTAKLSVPLPAMQYADLPFYFSTPDELYSMLDGEPGEILLKRLNAIDLEGVTIWENGFKQFTGDRPLRTPEDFLGLKIRTMKSRIIMAQFRSIEANPLPIDFHATHQALADGVVNGQENPLVAIVSMGFHEVQSDLTLSNHAYLGYVFSISSKVLATLPEDIQDILIETAKELTQWERREVKQREEALLQIVRDAGVRVHQLGTDEKQQFTAAMAHIAQRFEEVIGADIISKTEELRLNQALQQGGEPPIIIGLNADLSSSTRTSGLAIKRGATLAIEEINARGGVLGRKLALLARDHMALSSQGINNMELLIDNPNVVAVLGGQQSPIIMPLLPLIHREAIPFLAPWSSAEKVVENGFDKNQVFRLSANDRLTAPFIIEHLLKQYHRPAIILENSVWGQGNLANMSKALEQRGHEFVQVETINRGEESFGPVLSRIHQARADVVIMVVKPVEGSLIIHAVADQQKPLPVISHWGITGGHFWKDNREVLQKVDLSFFQTLILNESARPEAKQLVARYWEKYRVDDRDQSIGAPTGVAHAYDLIQLLALAIEQAGTTRRSAVRDALEQLPPYEGVVRSYTPAFSPQRHDALSVDDYYMARYDEQGNTVLKP